MKGIRKESLNLEFTPDHITELGENDIFVFGSNLEGHHAGGAARLARNNFGAKMGQGVGLQGNSYAIPTMQGGVDTIKPYVDDFIEFAKSHPELTFYVTKIGCGIAGFAVKEIAPLFAGAYDIHNIRLPKDFVNELIRLNNYYSQQYIINSQVAGRDKRIFEQEHKLGIVGLGINGRDIIRQIATSQIIGVKYYSLELESGNQDSVKLNDEDYENIEIKITGNLNKETREKEIDQFFKNEFKCPKNPIELDKIVSPFENLILFLPLEDKNAEYLLDYIWELYFNFYQMGLIHEHFFEIICFGDNDLIYEKIKEKYFYLKVIRENNQNEEKEIDSLKKYVFNKIYELGILKESVSDENEDPEGYPKLYKGVTTHIYGITRTFADIILGFNQEKHYQSPDEALDALWNYLDRYIKKGDDIAFISMRLLWNVINNKEIFKQDGLDIEAFRKRIFDFETFEKESDKAYDMYCREKLVNLIAYFNDYRHYSSPKEIEYDIERCDELQFSHCGPIEKFYYFIPGGATAMNYPVSFFINAMHRLWPEITSDGILDAKKMRKIMFEHHEDSLKKYGIGVTLANDYINDDPCHPEVFFPKKLGTGPVYVWQEEDYITKSCGEGKGPNRNPDYLEATLFNKVMWKDERYNRVRHYWIPKEDFRLPIFGGEEDRIFVNSEEELKEFVRKVDSGEIW